MENNLNNPNINVVLVIDDNQTDRYIAKRIISKLMIPKTVIELESGLIGIDYLKKIEKENLEKPDFIFLDIKMPQMDGFQFLEAFADLSESLKSSCNIYMLSSSLDPRDLEKAENNPLVKGFINKPLQKTIIQDLRENFLPQ